MASELLFDYKQLNSKRAVYDGVGVTLFSDGSEVFEDAPDKQMTYMAASYQTYPPSTMWNQAQTTHEDVTVEDTAPVEVLRAHYRPASVTQSLLTGSLDDEIVDLMAHFGDRYLDKVRAIIRPSPVSDTKVFERRSNRVKLPEFEIPEQRYSRLKMELLVFKKDLLTLATESPSEKDNCEAMIKGIHALIHSLDQLKAAYSGPQMPTDLFDKNLDLGRRTFMNDALVSILDDAVAMKFTEERRRPFQAPQSESVTEAKTQSEEESEGKQVWTISLKEPLAKAQGSWDWQFVTCEERIARLEKELGFSCDLRSPFPDFMHAVFYVDSKMITLTDPLKFKAMKTACHQTVSSVRTIGYTFDNWRTSMNKMAQRHKKMIDSELRRGQSKATLPLATASAMDEPPPLDKARSTSERRVMNDLEREELLSSFIGLEHIERLYEVMYKSDPSIMDLVHVCRRLTSLSRFHSRLAKLHSKVNTVHKQLNTISVSLLEDKRTLQTAKQSMAENTKQMKLNFAALKARLVYLEGDRRT